MTVEQFYRTIAVFLLALLAAAVIGYVVAQIADRRELALKRLRSPEPEHLDPLGELTPVKGVKPTSFVSGLKRMIELAGLSVDPKSFMLGASALALTLSIMMAFMGIPVYGALALGVLAATIAGWTILKHLRDRRERRFLDLLPDALETIVRGLRSGQPVSLAVATAAKELPEPIGSEFQIVADRVAYSGDLENAMRALYWRFEIPDLSMLVVSVSLHVRTGGNLSEILTNLARMMRERIRAKRRIVALSTEGRMSGNVLVASPMIIFMGIYFLMPGFYDIVWGEPILPYVVVGCIVSMLIGWLTIQRMVNFEV